LKCQRLQQLGLGNLLDLDVLYRYFGSNFRP
jgi:hypothetical protein